MEHFKDHLHRVSSLLLVLHKKPLIVGIEIKEGGVKMCEL